jgi:hypothetical protein
MPMKGSISLTLWQRLRGRAPIGRRACYLHVGIGKTGSSTIQYALTAAHKALLRQGYLYPDLSRNFRDVRKGLSTPGNGYLVNCCLRDGEIDEAMQQIAPYARRPQHLVLSCEGFSNRSGPALQEFGLRLRALGYDTKCLVLFRPLAEKLVSSYLQRAKTSKVGDMTLSDYVANRVRPERSQQWDWNARVQRLEQAFDEVTVKWYPSVKSLGPDGVVRLVFAWLGVSSLYEELERDHKLPRQGVSLNPTPGREALLVLQTLNANGMGDRNFAEEFLSRAQQSGLLGTRIVADRSILEMIDGLERGRENALIAGHCAEPAIAAEPEPGLAREADPGIDQDVVKELVAIASEILSRQRQKRSGQTGTRSIEDLFKDIGNSRSL